MVAVCGTATHAGDMSRIALPLRQLLCDRARPVRVMTVGWPIPELQGLDAYTHYNLVPAKDYPQFLSNQRVDIGLAP